MAKLQLIALVVFLISVILVDFVAQARHCSPPCASNERCVSANARERRSRHTVCVPRRCLHRPRRGRCLNFSKYHFDRATMSCRRIRSGSCYGGGNRFSSRENCELACDPWYRR